MYRDRPINQIVKQNTVDGLILINSRYTTRHFVDSYIKSLTELKFNFVVIDYYWGNARINCLGINYEKDAFKAVSYLIHLGHKKIALIAGTSKATVTSRIIKGYKRALADDEINIDNDIIVYADYDYQTAYAKTRTILQDHSSVTAFFLAGFEMAPACLKAVKDSGLNVPKDISIVCYIDSEIMPLLDPPITAIKWPYYEMGKKAAMVLLDNEKYKNFFLFETELMIRGSTDTRH